MTWIILAVVLLPLLVLALAVRPVLTSLAGLRRAALTLRRRQAQAEAMQAGAQRLADRAQAMQERLETAQRRIALIQAKRGER